METAMSKKKFGHLRILVPCTALLLGVAGFAALLGLTTLARAQPAAPTTGTIEGRVKNAVSGDYLNNARVSLKGTELVALTDESGTFRLAGVPAGAATLRVRFAGFDDHEVSITIAAGQTAQHDLTLASQSRYGETNATVKMDAFTVQSKKETDAAAIAVNEQRVGVGQKSVVSADQFGTLPDSNPGELMKWLPASAWNISPITSSASACAASTPSIPRSASTACPPPPPRPPPSAPATATVISR